MSGATLFAGPEIKAGRFGEHSDEVWDDVPDTQKIKLTIRDSPTQEVENLLLSSSSQILHTALVVGPMLYGSGSGPCNRRSIQLRRSQGRSSKMVVASDSMLDTTAGARYALAIWVE